MCGIVGLVGKGNVSLQIYNALTVLQHRGQDAAGIATTDGKRLRLHKNNGLVKDVFRTRHMRQLVGNMGLGHVRYPTAGCASSDEAQPFYVNSPYGISLAHNGNLTNATLLAKQLEDTNKRHLNTNSDSEILLNVFAHELSSSDSDLPTDEDIFRAVSAVYRRCEGGYAVVILIPKLGLIAFRDPYGIRPLVYGSRATQNGQADSEFLVSSESVALDALGYKMIDSIQPGEVIIIRNNGNISSQQCAENPVKRPCIFELVYFARPDSIIDDVSVYKTRLRMGNKLAKKILRVRPDHDIDVVIPVPDTSRSAAIQVAHHLGVKYREGFIKNRYIGRTFIMPGQKVREKSVRQKLNPIPLEFRSKNVLIVDDSIVRGTTSEQIIKMAREAGANRVYFASAAPPVRYPNVYGIDMPSASELIAHGKTEEEIEQLIGADWLIYQDLDDLIAAGMEGNPDLTGFEDSVFSGDYITGNISGSYLSQLEADRGDTVRTERDMETRGYEDL